MDGCVYVYVCMCVCVCMHACMYVCMYVYMYTCIYVCLWYNRAQGVIFNLNWIYTRMFAKQNRSLR